MKKWLIIGLVLVIICISLTVYSNIKENNINYTSMHDIVDNEYKIEGIYASLDATYVAGSITGDDNYSYFVIFGDGSQYIIYMKNSEANKIMKYLLDNPDESYRITGITKLIPETTEENGKKFVKTWLDNNHNHEEGEEDHTHEITTEEFYHYFGYVYMDTTIYNNFVDNIIIYITGITGITLLAFYFNSKYHLI